MLSIFLNCVLYWTCICGPCVYTRHCSSAIKWSADYNINFAKRSSSLIGGNDVCKTEYNISGVITV